MKKNILFFLLSCFLISILPAQNLHVPDQSIRVISYNIRYDNPYDGDNSWANRNDRVISLLRFHQADIFCLQEALINQIHDLEKAFPEYRFYGPGRDNGTENGEACPVFYNKKRFALKGSGTFWYSKTPEKPGSIGWGANLPRIASWARLRDLSTSQEIIVVSTHFDHQSQLSRNNSARLLKNKLNEISKNLPVIICGDFNDRPASETYLELMGQNNGFDLLDSRSISDQAHHGPDFTYIGFDFVGTPGNIIDYIFINNKFNVTSHGYLTDNWNGIYPSDHLPVFVELKVELIK
jgi:endonuclease/exonuclease/phosphatase family metal-dependent hydrolase